MPNNFIRHRNRGNRNAATPKPPEGQKLSDKSRLLWERYFNTMQAAAANMNTAIRNTENIIGGIILEMEGVSPDTHLFDMDRLTIIPRPPQE